MEREAVSVTEADVILWTGVSVGLIGLALTAANGVALIVEGFKEVAARAWQWIDRFMARFFPSRMTEIVNATLGLTASSGSSVRVAVQGTVPLPPDAPIAVQLDAIRIRLALLEGRIQQHVEQTEARHEALSSNIDSLATELREAISRLNGRLDEDASDAARTDARGLGPVAFGFVMVAVPHQLASISLFGAFFTLAALYVTAATARIYFPEVPGSSRT